MTTSARPRWVPGRMSVTGGNSSPPPKKLVKGIYRVGMPIGWHSCLHLLYIDVAVQRAWSMVLMHFNGSRAEKYRSNTGTRI